MKESRSSSLGVDQEKSTARTEAPASSPLPEWVRRCRSTDPRRTCLHEALVFQFEGEDWTGATNGHRLAAIRGAWQNYARFTDVPDAPDLAKVMKRPPDPEKRHAINVRDLIQWLGIDAVKLACTNCEGKGEWECDQCSGVGYYDCTCDCGDEHERDCRVCNATGMIRCPECFPSSKDEDYGRIFDTAFDRSVLRPVITHLPYETCYLHLDGERAAWLYDDSGDWIVLVMPLRPEPKRDAKLPAFGDMAVSA